MILRRQDAINNNGITPSHKRDKTDNNIKMPLIGNKLQIDEPVSEKNKLLLTKSKYLFLDKERKYHFAVITTDHNNNSNIIS
jgi:hypothetical protein